MFGNAGLYFSGKVIEWSTMKQIIEIIIKCYRASVDLSELATLLDAILQQNGYEVHEIITRIKEEKDEDFGQDCEGDSPRE